MSDPSSSESSAAPARGSSSGQPLLQPALVRRWKFVLSALLVFAAGLTIGVYVGIPLGADRYSRMYPPRPSSDTLRAHSASISVQNRSSVDFRRVLVNGESFGDIRSGESTEFHSMQHVYRYAAVSVETPSGSMAFWPIDYVGERQLSQGRYMYVLTTEHGKLVIECVVIM